MWVKLASMAERWNMENENLIYLFNFSLFIGKFQKKYKCKNLNKSNYLRDLTIYVRLKFIGLRKMMC